MSASPETAFQVQNGGALYILRHLDPDTAEGYGCPGATVMLIGRHGHIIGSTQPVTGRAVRVPGWPSRRGVLAVFTPAVVDENTQPLKGWIGE